MVYTLRVVSPDGGWPRFRYGFERGIAGARKCLMRSTALFLRDAFQNLRTYAEDGRLLVIERRSGGESKIVGCIAYDLLSFMLPEPERGCSSMCRVIILRLLAIDEEEDPNRAESYNSW